MLLIDKLWIQLPQSPPLSKKSTRMETTYGAYAKLNLSHTFWLKSDKSTDNPLSTPVIEGLHRQNILLQVIICRRPD